MATIKSYTDIEQSRKLAEILPLESADGGWYGTTNPLAANTKYWLYTKYTENAALPAWSLAALLSVLPMITKGKENANPFIAKTPNNEYYVVYATLTKEIDSSAIYDNPVDACVNMIEELNELKML